MIYCKIKTIDQSLKAKTLYDTNQLAQINLNIMAVACVTNHDVRVDEVVVYNAYGASASVLQKPFIVV